MGKRKSSGIIKIPEKQLQTIIRKEVRAEIYSGPLPHPAHLERYEKLYPGAAKLLLELLDIQAKHRMGIEKTVIASNIINERRGQLFAFIICMTVIVGGFVAIYFEKNVLGISSVLGSLAVLAAVFFGGKSRSKKELQKRAQP